MTPADLYAWYFDTTHNPAATDQQRVRMANFAARVYGVTDDEQRRYWDAVRARQADQREPGGAG